jgi:hypothetical protein
MGLLIAAGLHQIYEYIQRRTRALLEAERKAATADPLPPQDPAPTSQP